MKETDEWQHLSPLHLRTISRLPSLTPIPELAVLVIDQGTILDRIDFNMEQVVERTQEGLVQLGKVRSTPQREPFHNTISASS